MILLNKPYEESKAIPLVPMFDSNEDVVGANWSDEDFLVRIHKRNSDVFQINSDIARSMYKYYFKN